MLQAVVAAPPAVRRGVLLPAAALIAAGWIALTVAREHSTVSSFVSMWAAMTVGMMIPTAVRPMLRAADGSAARAWSFLLGFAAVWLAVGVPTYAVLNAVAWTPFWISAAWLVAGAYQLTPALHRQLGSCRSVRFDGDPLAYGVRQAARCVASCWPVMTAAMVTAMILPGVVLPLVLLLALTVLLCWQREPGTTRQAVRAVGVGMILLAAAGFVVGGGGGAVHHSDVASSGLSTS